MGMIEADADHQELSALLSVMDRALRALGDHGETELASRLAAEAWALTRGSHPQAAEALTRTLHYLAARHGLARRASVAKGLQPNGEATARTPERPAKDGLHGGRDVR